MNHPAPVELTYEHMRFLIIYNTANVTLNKLTEELKKYGVMTITMTIVRVCEATYDRTPVGKKAAVFSTDLLMMVYHHPTRLLMAGKSCKN